mmetsp:Transcript_83485/g.239832  ORF Transcript_83485/g.239832 Transcript_83485/m.239832 type:complete len:208 (-) Transcript_83485:146-769(-)
MVIDLDAVSHALQPHGLRCPLFLQIFPRGDELLQLFVGTLDLVRLLILSSHQSLHLPLKFLGLLAEPIGIALDLCVLSFVPLVHNLVGRYLALQCLKPLIALREFCLVALLLLTHHGDLLLKHLALISGPLKLGFGLGLSLGLALLELHLLLALLVIQLRELDLQHHVPVLNDLVLVLDLLDLVVQLRDSGLVLHGLGQGLLQADLL